jgi:hypothetical protein
MVNVRSAYFKKLLLTHLDDLYHSMEWIDAAITHRAKTFPALFNGEYAGKYNSDESEADFALVKDLLHLPDIMPP